MLTYLVRHGRTAYSAAYRLNGDPAVALPLDEVGEAQCAEAASQVPVAKLASCVASAFPRAIQTARRLLGDDGQPLTLEPRLNELDYGVFEGRAFLDYADWLTRHGPRARPPGAAESQREGIRRMAQGVRSSLGLPGPRLLVGHGLLLSVLTWALEAKEQGSEIFFPEAPYVTPLVLPDERLADLLQTLLNWIDAPVPDAPTAAWAPSQLTPGSTTARATFGHTEPLEEENA